MKKGWQRPRQHKKEKKKNKEKKKKKELVDMGIFVYQVTSFSSFSFLSNLKTKLFDGSREKVLTIFFPLFPPNQTHSKKFFSIFSPKFFIHPISPQNKDTLNDLCFKIQDIFLHEMGFRPIQSLCTFRASDPSQLFQAL